MEVRTLGQFVEQEGVLDDLTGMIAEVNARATHEAKQLGKVSCLTCTAAKACCHSLVVARFYEGVVVAGLLRREGRDTPELRGKLAETATAMEAADPYGWRRPCVFLDERERCTVYAGRPTPCGILYVYSPPAACSDPLAKIRAYVPHAEHAVALELEERFRERLSLRKKVGRRYLGVLPRMALLALEMWDRTDFRDALRAHPWPTDEEVARWDRRA
ncbi:MAG TPA: YkgJ family cysteine cluster protein [Kofleriaceae bacterium]|jgi:Fe-S-cluster containining protein